MVRPDRNIPRNLVPRVIFWSHPSVKCPSWYKLYMSSESESEDDLLEQAYDYKVNGRYPEGCTLNKKRSIRGKWISLFYRMAKCA